ncbi:hypothetical protein CC86DRAFT_16440 [Ophiobolus disseminans]|uniref:Uncharacterized protein n=1 Tax=Ophiobolus disseminans TaxID=1469910 RepID=A0A6A7AKW2_9PLEO|nr:hypothetical protein CC86DRAFT_16440 [Ophiobolus disseminans]
MQPYPRKDITIEKKDQIALKRIWPQHFKKRKRYSPSSQSAQQQAGLQPQAQQRQMRHVSPGIDPKQRFTGERQISMHELQRRSRAYDKQLLAKIGGPTTPKRASRLPLSGNFQDFADSHVPDSEKSGDHNGAFFHATSSQSNQRLPPRNERRRMFWHPIHQKMVGQREKREHTQAQIRVCGANGPSQSHTSTTGLYVRPTRPLIHHHYIERDYSNGYPAQQPKVPSIESMINPTRNVPLFETPEQATPFSQAFDTPAIGVSALHATRRSNHPSLPTQLLKPTISIGFTPANARNFARSKAAKDISTAKRRVHYTISKDDCLNDTAHHRADFIALDPRRLQTSNRKFGYALKHHK